MGGVLDREDLAGRGTGGVALRRLCGGGGAGGSGWLGRGLGAGLSRAPPWPGAGMVRASGGDCHALSAFFWWWGARCVSSWFLSALEGLDDDHGSSAVWARLGEGRRFRVIGGLGVIGLGGRHGEQLAGTGDVSSAPAIGKEPVMADAVETGRQDVDKKAADELAGGGEGTRG